MFITLVKAILLYRDKVLEITVMDWYCSKKLSEMFKVCIMISEPMIWNMMNSKKYVIKHRVKDLTIFVLIWLKIEIMVKIVFSTKVKPHILIVFLKLNLFKNIFLNKIIHVFCKQIHSHSFKWCFRLET